MAIIRFLFKVLQAILNFAIFCVIFLAWPLAFIPIPPELAGIKAFSDTFVGGYMSSVRLLEGWYQLPLRHFGIEFDLTYVVAVLGILILKDVLYRINYFAEKTNIKQSEVSYQKKLEKEREESEKIRQSAGRTFNMYKSFCILPVLSKKSKDVILSTNTPESNRKNSLEDLEVKIRAKASLFLARKNFVNDKTGFIFNNIENLVEFFIFIKKEVESFNKVNTYDQISFKMALDVLYKEEIDREFDLLERILNISLENDILSTEIFYNVYISKIKRYDIKVSSKGMYSILGKNRELFSFKIS